MYKQSMNTIKLVIISLDSTLLNLNKLRFNYCKNFAEERGINLSKLDFYNNISNVYTMYEHLPFSNGINTIDFSLQIERDLKSYYKYHTLDVKPGVEALLQGLKNKGIKTVFISNSKEQNARFYLNKSGLENYCDLLVSANNLYRPLPANDVLKDIQNRFNVISQDILVVSSYTTLNKAAQSLSYNIIYVTDFINPTQYDIASSYRCVSDLYGVLSIILFDKYDDDNLYASILGFNPKMNKVQLQDRYEHLLTIYKDDQDIISIVDKTYKHCLTKFNENIMFVDYPSDSTSISDTQRENIQKQVKESLINDQNEAKELFNEETIEMVVQRLANDESEPVQEATPDESAEAVKQVDNNVNEDIQLTIDKLRASIDEVLNEASHNASDTHQVLTSDSADTDNDTSTDTVDVSQDEKDIQTIKDDRHEEFIEVVSDTKKNKEHHKKGYSFADWFIDVVLLLLINLLICVVAAILYIVFIERGVITNNTVLTAVSYIGMYVNLCVTYVGKYLSEFISDVLILSLLSVYIVDSVITIILNTFIKLIKG